jgi:hypothetical protein
MEPNKICDLCGSPLEWKEGVSKTTNKPYGFWGCPNYADPQHKAAKASRSARNPWDFAQDREDIHRMNQPNEDFPTAWPQPNAQPKKAPQAQADSAVWDAKDRQSMAQTAFKSASEIVAALIGVGQFHENTEEVVKNMAIEFYKQIQKIKNEQFDESGEVNPEIPF